MNKNAANDRKLTRRRFMGYAAGALVAAVAADGFVVEPRWLRVTRPGIHLPRLPRVWDGLRISHLTDLHRGRFMALSRLTRLVETTNHERADLIVLTGDLVSRHDAIDDEYADVLARLSAPLGVWGVLGNHDHWAGAEGVRGMFKRAGIGDLTNRHTILTRQGESLCLAGVDDPMAGRPDLDAALAGVPEETARVLLCHNPDYAEAIPLQPRVDLMLSGHSHGGQVKIPFGPRPIVPLHHTRYAAGLVQGPRCLVYTSVGVGTVGIPVRFNCRPELAVITLSGAGTSGS